jgi:hypothetical protein
LSRPPEPLGDERFLIRFTADHELHAQLQELKSLMRHQIPDGDVGKILAKAVAVLLKQVRARKFGECSAPRAARYERIVPIESAERAEQAATPSPSRQIPAAIRRAVSKRDGERCTFVSATGRRCSSRDFLEFHHCEPWARHRLHSIDVITLRCRAHNQYEAERDFGAKHMRRFRRREQPQTAELLPQTAELLPEAADLLPQTAELLPETAELLPEASALFLDTEALLPEASALSLETETSRSHPNLSPAHQRELDLNPVGVR